MVPSEDAGIAGVRLRIRQGTGIANYRELARATGCNAETVRRYMTVGVPNLGFIMAVCKSWNISANWVLFGVGPQHGLDLTSHVICEVKAESLREVVGELVRAIGEGMRELRQAPPLTTAWPEDRPARGPIVLHPPGHKSPRAATGT